jgi:urea transport system permease protein
LAQTAFTILDLPDFMVFLDWKELPWFWLGTDNFIWVVFLILLILGLIAFIFGFFAFRSRIKGVYLSIITQALTYAAMLLFFRNETGFGGNNGFTDFKRILGFSIAQSWYTGCFIFIKFYDVSSWIYRLSSNCSV